MVDRKAQFLNLMFVDIPGVLELGEAQGEQAAREFLDEVIRRLGVIWTDHGGRLIRTVGNAFLCTFADADAAVMAACTMQALIPRLPKVADSPPAMRVALHNGRVFVDKSNCVGPPVAAVARLVTVAESNQILATGEVAERCSPKTRGRITELESLSGPARALKMALFEVRWGKEPHAGEAQEAVPAAAPAAPPDEQAAAGDAAATDGAPPQRPSLSLSGTGPDASAKEAIRLGGRPSGPVLKALPDEAEPPPAAPRRAPSTSPHLCLFWRNRLFIVDRFTPGLSVGRSDSNDVSLDVYTASRRHADIECREGTFVLVDHSGNGTFLYDEGGTERVVEQDEVRLGDSGVISPGCPSGREGAEELRYVLVF